MGLNIFLFLLGFVLLLKGADILTDAGTLIARKLKVSEFIIGLIIVGIGTSIPELIVTLFSSLEGSSPVGIGTIVGSNTLNILLILGISALIAPLELTKAQVWRHLPLNIFAVAVVGLMVRFGFRLENGAIGLSRLEGFLLLALFFIWIYYLYYLYLIGEGHHGDFKKAAPAKPQIHEHTSLPMLVIAGLIGIIIGGEWVTDGAVALARFFGVKEAVVGLTIVGLGTSLPELSASAVAAYKRNYGMAVGNIIGSNIFDFLLIFGLVAAMKTLPFSEYLLLDLWVTVISAVLLLVAVLVGKKYVLKRWQGWAFIFLYVMYVTYLIFLRP